MMPGNSPNEPVPGPDCRLYELVLPLLDAGALSAKERADVRRHAAGCEWCSRRLDAYATIDGAVRRHVQTLMAEAKVQTKQELLRLGEGTRNVPNTNSASRNRYLRRRLEAFGALAAVLILGLLAGLIFSSHAGRHTSVSSYGTHVITSGTTSAQATCNPNVLPPGVPGSHVTLSSISMVSATAGWAVGTVTHYSKVAQTSRTGIIMQLVNGRWIAFGQLYPGVNLQSVSMDSADDGWALGSRESGGLLALHYTGGQWVSVSLPGQVPNGAASTVKVEMVSPTDGWMLAQYSYPRLSSDPATRGVIGIWRYQNGNWTPVPIPSMPDTVEFWDMSATATGGIWFVGTDYARSPTPISGVIAGLDNGHWSFTLPTPGSADQLTAVSMASATDGWAVGYTTHGGKTNEAPVLLHFNGTDWTAASLPPIQFEDLTGINAFPDGDAWLTGIQNASTESGRYDYVSVLAENAGGSWQRVPIPYTSIHLGQIAEVGPGQFWATGESGYTWGCAPEMVREVVTGSVLHYAGGSWGKQDLP